MWTCGRHLHTGGSAVPPRGLTGQVQRLPARRGRAAEGPSGGARPDRRLKPVTLSGRGPGGRGARRLDCWGAGVLASGPAERASGWEGSPRVLADAQKPVWEGVDRRTDPALGQRPLLSR